MTCDPDELMDAARCFRCIPDGEELTVALVLLCAIVAVEAENPAAPCELSATISFPGPTFTMTWQNPVVYDLLEVWHKPISGPAHIETTLAGTATSFSTSSLAPMDFFSVRGKIGDDYSAFAHSGPCV